jgi:hypothetical protein
MQVYRGHHVTLQYTGIPESDELMVALIALDRSCRFGNGGGFFISAIDPKSNVPAKLRAEPDGPFETLYYADGKWVEGDKLAWEDDVYDDDEECECGDCNPDQQINA